MPLLLFLTLTFGNPYPSVLVLPTQPPTPKEIAVQVAVDNHINVEQFLNVIQCESDFVATSTGDYPDGHGHFVPKYLAPKGSKPTSFGIAQLHDPEKNWGITKEQAFEPRTALTLMAKAWNNGEASRWSCYRAFYGYDS